MEVASIKCLDDRIDDLFLLLLLILVRGGEEKQNRTRFFGEGKYFGWGEEEERRILGEGKFFCLGARKVMRDRQTDRQTDRVSSCKLDPFCVIIKIPLLIPNHHSFDGHLLHVLWIRMWQSRRRRGRRRRPSMTFLVLATSKATCSFFFTTPSRATFFTSSRSHWRPCPPICCPGLPVKSFRPDPQGPLRGSKK